MKIAIMQPYLFPYIGYWQLISAVDKFVIYDNIQYEKNGWMRRNRIMSNGTDKLFTVPIAKGSDYADVKDRKLTDNYKQEISKILRTVKGCYCKAPFFDDAYPVIEKSLFYESENLFQYIYNSVKDVCEYLKIGTEIIISSSLDIDHSLKKEYRVMEICKCLEADTYINPSGGIDLYSKEKFAKAGIDLQFLKARLTPYTQGKYDFLPALSIIDMMMNISKEEIQHQLKDYIII